MDPRPEFCPGANYLIICKVGDLALKVQQNDPSKFHHSRIGSALPNPEDNRQIFMIEQAKTNQHGDVFYQIINCVSNCVLDKDERDVKLHHDKASKDQLYKIEVAPVQGPQKYYWIRNESKCLYLESVLRSGQFDVNNENQLFRINQVTNHSLQNSIMLINNLSGKAASVPDRQSVYKHGEKIQQHTKDKKWPQKWLIQKHGKGVIFRNILNNLCLDIAGQSHEDGAVVIQTDQSGRNSQLWLPEKNENGLYKLRNSGEQTLFLSIKDESVQDGGVLEVSKGINPSTFWKIVRDRWDEANHSFVQEDYAL